MRERLLLKAKQSETAAGIETWISSPGSQAPDNLDLLKKPGINRSNSSVPATGRNHN